MLVSCPPGIVDATLAHLWEAGTRRCECVVLWLARRFGTGLVVQYAYRPNQHAEADMFHIPRESMAALHAELRAKRLMVAAQVHSHPQDAFHSRADDRWAIIRHEGALSLVVPDFAKNTRSDNFLGQAKIFRFSDSAKWLEVSRTQAERDYLCIR